MKNTIFLILYSLLCLTGFSQSSIRINNYWENTYYITPASIYSEYRYTASVAGRKQYVGFPGSPDTEYITFTARFNTKSNTEIGQIGLKAYRDKIGYTTLLNISPSFSYPVILSERLHMSLGIAYKIQRFTYDVNEIQLETPDDPAVRITETQWENHNADVGVEFVGNSIMFGAVSQNLMSLFTNERGLQTNSNFLYAMYRYEFEKSFSLLSGICGINNKEFYQAEFNLSLLLDIGNSQNLQLGVLYRTIQELGVLFGVDLSKTARLAFSYDFDVGGIKHGSYGSPELMLVWKFGEIDCEPCSELFK